MRFRRSSLYWTVLVVLGSLSSPAGAQSPSGVSPYSEFEDRDIKALSSEQIEGYRSGSGMGFALAAELNGYPGPKHVLELRQALGLSVEQVKGTEEVFAAMSSAAEELGREIVDREAELDRLFRAHEINADSLGTRALEIGELQGRLRAVHLRAHLEMMKILEPHQVLEYAKLRGYHGGQHTMHDPSAEHGGTG